MYNDPKGSNWRKWDLHVHTPASLVHHYAGGADGCWENFLYDLEHLPESFKVIGINDYIFIDGYRLVMEAKEAGRLKNIELIFPVIELRLDKFGGTDSHLSRVNFHVIFSDEVSPDIIQSQFLNGLTRKYYLSLSPNGKQLNWNAIVTRESLADLGSRIIESVPSEKRKQFGSPEKEGFNNINFDYENVLSLLQSHYFEGKFLTAVGKTEWADIKWNDQSIADKKNIINNADFVFISAESAQVYHRSREQLRTSQVNSKLLDCSDAHHNANSIEKDRIGNCFTWVKADPTFEGLRQTLEGFDERVFVGDIPEKVRSVQSSPTRYIKALKINKKAETNFDEVWFEGTKHLEFNHGLVAIIGNKGNAKSALTDIIGLLGNTRNHENFSFLTAKKFRQPSINKAKHFEASLIWESKSEMSKPLDAEVSAAEVEMVKYIPQNFFEAICNEVPGKEESDFDRELEQVIFSHVTIPARLGKNSLRELIEHRTHEVNESIALLKAEIQTINTKIVEIEDQQTEDYRKSTQNKLGTKRKELEAHLNAMPPEIHDPAKVGEDERKASVAPEIEKQKMKIEQLDQGVKAAQEKEKETALLEDKLEKAIQKIENFRGAYEKAQKEFEKLKLDGIKFTDLVKVEMNDKPLKDALEKVRKEKTQAANLLDESIPDSLLHQRMQVQADLSALQEKLDAPNKEYQDYLKRLEEWEEKRKKIQSDQPQDSIEFYEALLRKIDDLPNEFASCQKQRADNASKIYSRIQTLVTIYKDLYAPVQEFIQKHPLANKFSLNFDVSIVDKGFGDRFFEWVNQGKAGTFTGTESGKKSLDEILAKCNFNEPDATAVFLEEIAHSLTHDVRSSTPTKIQVKKLMKKGKTTESLYDFIFSLEYLKPHYILKMGEKEIHQLSPGEKGALLLVFYLLVDKDDIPLIIDQPEENLDNQTVYDLLVPSIDEARKRRQIFIVTHNPNLAVVCDAEQIIYAAMDKKNGNKVEYTSGAIENPEINKRLLDVLEGTRPAFYKRHSKYIPEQP